MTPAKPAPLTSAEKQRRRRSELDAIAQAAGWPTWGKYETEVKRGAVAIAASPAPAPRRKRQQKEKRE